MSPDVIGIIIAMVGAVATIFGGMYALLNRFESRIEVRMDSRFDEVDRRFEDVDRRIAEVKEDISIVREDVRTLSADVVDIKVSVARLEGPQPTLLRTRLS